jgi:uncharacterized membrane protein YkoI
MNAKLNVVASLFFAAGLALAADRVDPGQLPSAVKKALDASASGDAVKQITIHTVNGRTVYDIELEKKIAPNPRLRIAEDGQVLRDTTTDAPSVYSEYGATVLPQPKLKLSDTPAAVQDTIKKEAAGREIGTIEREHWNGKPGYRVTFREPGRNPEFYVADDGTSLKPEEKPPALFIGTRFEDTPAAVQQTIRREVGNGEIVKINKEGRRGEPAFYKIDLKDTRGTYQIRVSENGQILENSRATGRPADRD